MASFVESVSEVLSIGRQCARTGESQVQVRIAIEERAIRMVQEIVTREAEGEFLVLGRPERKVLEQ